MSRRPPQRKAKLKPSPAKKQKPFITRFFETGREPLMFLVGLASFIFQLGQDGPERLGLLAMSGLMMGLPIAMGSDIWRRRNGYEEE